MADSILCVGLDDMVRGWMPEDVREAANLADALFLLKDTDDAGFSVAAVSTALLDGADGSSLAELHRHMPVLLLGKASPHLAGLADGSMRVEAGSEGLPSALAEARMRWSRERREKLLAQIEAVGQLAGGTAHDFNNLLTVILGNLELIEVSAADPKILDLSEAAISAAESGTRMTARLGNFSNRTGDSQPRDLNSLVTRNVNAITRQLDGKFDVRASLQQGEIPLTVDGTRIEKILLNLGANAADAMEPGGRITVETSTQPIEIGGDTVHVLAEPLPQRYAVMTVRDAGSGMEPSVLRHAGDLFFSTRDRGRGAGVGLSIALAYAQLEGGTIAIDSSPGNGTAVHCLFPMPQSEHIVVEGVGAGAAASLPLKVLLLDDDAMVGESTAQMLQQLGHSVVRAPSGKDVLRMLNLDGDYDLVLTDIHMPGDIDGVELARMVREAYTNLPVLLFSGSVASIEGGGGDVLRKPFTLEQLQAAVRTVVPV